MAFEDLLTLDVRRKLVTLKGLLRAHLVGRGLCWAVLAAVTAVFFTLGVDWLLRMNQAQRAVFMVLSLAGIGFICWRFLFRPLRVPMGAEDLALVLEEHYPDLDDRLISVLQFATRDTSRTGASEAMIRKVAEQANQAAGQIDPKQPVASEGTWKRMGWPGAALLVLIVFTVFNPDVMMLWFKRNVLLGNERWPQETYLTVVARYGPDFEEAHRGPEFRIGAGRKLQLEVTAKGPVIPARVTFHMKYASLPGEVKEAVAAIAPGAGKYVKGISNTSEGFKFYVTGNDDKTRRFTVIVLPPPQLIELSGVKHYPDYMSRAPSEFRPAHGLIAVPAGSRLHFSGLADKDLSRARLLLDGRHAAELSVTKVTSDANAAIKGRPRGIKGTLQLPERVGRPTMLLQFELTDTENVSNPNGAAYSLRINPDRPPVVGLTRRHVRGEVTAVAEIPALLQARDDCGVAALAMTVQRIRGTGTAAAGKVQKFEVTGFKAGEKDVRAEHLVDLRGFDLKVGDRVRLQAVAQDTLPESFGGPNKAHSVVQTFRIVSPEKILEELVRRQKEIREDFHRTLVLQAGIRDRVRGLGDYLKLSAPDAETRRRLKEASRDQRRVAAQCAVAAQQFTEVLEEMKHNRVGSPGEHQQLATRIIEPLSVISKKPMSGVVAAMERASKMTDARILREFTVETAGVLDDMVAQLNAILERMQKLASRQELAYRLKIIIDISSEIDQAIKQLLDQKVRDVVNENDEEDDKNKKK